MNNEKEKLKYIIKGKKLDSNVVCENGKKIIWRTNKTKDDIEFIMQKIYNRINNIAINFNITQSSLKFYNLPLIQNEIQSNKYIIKRNQNCDYNFIQKIYDIKEKQANKYIATRHSKFLTKKFLSNSNIKLQKIKNKHLVFCKNKSKNIEIDINANIFLCKNKNWIEEYKKSIKPVVCNNFYIRPSWYKENIKYHNIIIDPSLSFGSGHHATTNMCIEFLSNLKLNNKTLLDVGCGSGILSIVGAKLGAKVYACDTDIYAYEQSKLNFKTNKLKYEYIWHGSISTINKQNNIPNQYDFICANIVSSVIVMLRNEFISCLKHNGILILSGILKEYEKNIIEKFSKLEILQKKQNGEWLGFKFIKK